MNKKQQIIVDCICQERQKSIYLKDAEAKKLKSVKEYLVLVGKHEDKEKFTLSIAKDYLNRFQHENPILWKELPTLSSSTVEAAW